MAKAWITDLWVKDATATLPDGTVMKITPTREQMRSIKTLPDHFRTSKWMTGKRWRVGWYEDGNNGQTMRTRSFTGKQEAEEFAAELEDDIRMGRYIDPKERERPFSEIAELWLGSKASIKDSTWLRYRRELDTYVLPRWKGTAIGAIQRKDVEKWVAELADGTATAEFKSERARLSLSPSSIWHIVEMTFGGTIRYALTARILTLNPAYRIALPRKEGEEIGDLPILTVPEVESLAAEALTIAQLDGRRKEPNLRRVGDDTLVRLLAYCGPRVNEALALKVGDIDLEVRRIQVRRTWTKSKTGMRKLSPPKTWEKRKLPIPDFLVPELRALIGDRAPGAYLFVTDSGATIEHKNWYNRVWLKALKAVGFREGFTITIHDLRHTAASLAIASGADVKLVQNMLGHKDANETLNTYSHLWPDRLDEVMDSMSEFRNEALGLTETEAEEPEDEEAA